MKLERHPSPTTQDQKQMVYFTFKVENLIYQAPLHISNIERVNELPDKVVYQFKCERQNKKTLCVQSICKKKAMANRLRIAAEDEGRDQDHSHEE